MNKIRQYFSTLELTRGLGIALLSSAFIYLNHWGVSCLLCNTVTALGALYLLLQSTTKTWFIAGAFTGLLWFWWIPLSFIHYQMLWAIPIGLLVIMLMYGFIFAFIAWFSTKISSFIPSFSLALTLSLKALGIFGVSYVHPLGFDWFKPVLMFTQSYIGIQNWQFAIVLMAMTLTLWKKNFLYLLLLFLAYEPNNKKISSFPHDIAIISTYTSVHDKWDTKKHDAQFDALFRHIDTAIHANKKLVILPESVFPLFLNRSKPLLSRLKEKAQHISIVTGALYWDGTTPRNSTYIFTNEKIQVANKVILVPFGEANPLPDFLSTWVNKVFYDDAVDYKADTNVTDYTIDGITYRNAICFEATAEQLYKANPKYMIILSNNAWFSPSTEPTLQKLLLLYYNKKYNTTMYHAINMSPSYMISNGKILEVKP